jgi:hypothetical protein
MGSIFSFAKPKKPKAQTTKVVYVPASSTTTTTGTSSETSSDEAVTTEADVAQTRAENLLRRNRSRLGTVLTGFRGVLAPSELSAQRKTLLGE